MVYLHKFQLKGKDLRVPVVNIKDTTLLQKYVHIYPRHGY